MKCEVCKTKNIMKANYCKNCGHKFLEKEKKIYRKKTLVGKLEMIEKAYNICSLKVITSHIIFKIVSIIIILGIGIFFSINNGVNLKLLESDNYKIQYNKNENVYYLIVEDNKINLNLYVPEKCKYINLKYFDSNNNIKVEDKYEEFDNIILNSNDSNGYYLIESIYDKNNLDQIKLFVYLKDYIEV